MYVMTTYESALQKTLEADMYLRYGEYFDIAQTPELFSSPLTSAPTVETLGGSATVGVHAPGALNWGCPGAVNINHVGTPRSRPERRNTIATAWRFPPQSGILVMHAMVSDRTRSHHQMLLIETIS